MRNLHTHIYNSASMLHAALCHTTKRTTITASTKVCNQPRGVAEKTSPPPHARLHREQKGAKGMLAPQQAKQDIGKEGATHHH